MMGFGVLGSPWNSDGGSEFRNVCGGLHFRFWGLGMARMGLGFFKASRNACSGCRRVVGFGVWV